MDIVVTTPKNSFKSGAAEAIYAKKHDGYYFRVFNVIPKKINVGCKIFYVYDNNVVGFAKIVQINTLDSNIVCDVTKKLYSGKYIVWIDPKTWVWIKPIPMKGFRGFRYIDLPDIIPINQPDNNIQ